MGTCVLADGSSRVGVGAGVVQPLPLTRSRSVASMGDARGRRRATAMLSATFVAISYNEASAQERATCSQVVQNQPRGQGAPVLLASFVSLAYQSFWSLGDCSSCLFELRCCCIFLRV